MFLFVGEGSSNRNTSRDESVKGRVESVECGDESIEAREKVPWSVYILANGNNLSIWVGNFMWKQNKYIHRKTR